MKKLVLLYEIRQFETYLKREKDLEKDPEVKIIAFTIELRFFLKNNNIPYYIQEEYITEEEMVNLDEMAFKFAKNWAQNKFKFININLSHINLLISFYLYCSLFLKIHTILRLIELEKPTEIISVDSKNFHIKEFLIILEYLCSIKNIHLNLHSIDKKKSEFTSKLDEPNINSLISLFNILGKLKSSISLMKIVLKYIYLLKNLITKVFKKKKKNILFFGYKYNESIIEAISGKYNQIFLDHRPDILKNRDILNLIKKNRKFFEFYESRKINKQTNLYFKILLKEWLKIIEESFFQEFFVFQKISIWPIIKKKLLYYDFYQFRDFIKFILISYKILSESKYDLIILESDLRHREKIFSIIASKLNIPTLVIQHGIGAFPSTLYPYVSKYYAVWGKRNRDEFIKSGMDFNKIVITGSPRYDQYFSIKDNQQSIKKIKESVYRNFQIEKDKKLIILATTHGDKYKNTNSMDMTHLEIEKMFEIVFNVMKKLTNSHLIIKLRQVDDFREIPFKMKHNYGIENVSITVNYNIVDLITSCDCFITGSSTTILEAMIINKPIIIIRSRKSTEIIQLDDDIVEKVSSIDELLSKINECFNKTIPTKKYKKYLEDYIYKTDGQATKRTLNLINSILYKSHNLR